MTVKTTALLALLAAFSLPAYADIPAALQGKWVGYDGKTLNAAELRRYCSGQVSDESVIDATVARNGFSTGNIGGGYAVDRLQLSTRTANRVAGVGRMIASYEDDSQDPPKRSRFDLRLDGNKLVVAADWIDGRAVYQRCPR